MISIREILKNFGISRLCCPTLKLVIGEISLNILISDCKRHQMNCNGEAHCKGHDHTIKHRIYIGKTDGTQSVHDNDEVIDSKQLQRKTMNSNIDDI